MRIGRLGPGAAVLALMAGCNPYAADGVRPDHPALPSRPVPSVVMAPPVAAAPATPHQVPPVVPQPLPPPPPTAPPTAVKSAAPAQPVEPQVVDEGWQGLMWGMSKADIRQVMPTAGEVKEKIGKTERVGFGLPRYPMPGCAARALMDFTPQGGLKTVRVVGTGTVDAACIRAVRKGLADKYGVPASEEKPKGGMDIHNAVWRRPGVIVSLVSSLDAKGQGLFQIAYANPAEPAAAPSASQADGDLRGKL